MESQNVHWTEEQFKAYLFLYCANVDFIEQEEEIDLIKHKVDKETLKTMHREFDKDSDFQRIQKIQAYVVKSNYSEAQRNELLTEIETIFMADGVYHVLERNAFLGLKHLLK